VLLAAGVNAREVRQQEPGVVGRGFLVAEYLVERNSAEHGPCNGVCSQRCCAFCEPCPCRFDAAADAGESATTASSSRTARSSTTTSHHREIARFRNCGAATFQRYRSGRRRG